MIPRFFYVTGFEIDEKLLMDCLRKFKPLEIFVRMVDIFFKDFCFFSTMTDWRIINFNANFLFALLLSFFVYFPLYLIFPFHLFLQKHFYHLLTCSDLAFFPSSFKFAVPIFYYIGFFPQALLVFIDHLFHVFFHGRF